MNNADTLLTNTSYAVWFFSKWHWVLLCVLALLIGAEYSGVTLSSTNVTAIFAAAILFAGIPHGTLDVEIIAQQLGNQSWSAKLRYTIIYIMCAAVMAGTWYIFPVIALITFLAMSAIHFGRDWRLEKEPFLGFMVGTALIALPAISHNAEVASIFNILTGSSAGYAIADGLACISLPPLLASLVFCGVAVVERRTSTAVNVAVCLIAAITLPPLVAFAMFFCGLHSPRHFKDALDEAGGASLLFKAGVICAVSALSLAIGTGIFMDAQTLPVDEGVIRMVFILLSILTLPHFLLEQILPRIVKQRSLGQDL
jgi:beta-carotene 15,15'-dioxygenase